MLRAASSAGTMTVTRTPAITVAVCTYRRPEALRRALAGVAAQRAVGLDWEVLVVDGEAPSGSAAVIDAYDGPIRTVHESAIGAAAARNRAVAEARGELLAFLDDDVVPDPGWLSALVAPLVAGRADAGGGPV